MFCHLILTAIITALSVDVFFCIEAQQPTNITHSTATLSEARFWLAATFSGDLVFFGGGHNTSLSSDRVDICNVTSGIWTTATLSVPRFALAAASLGNLVFFAGGWDGNTNFSNQVDIYNVSDGNWSTATLSQGRRGLAATSIGSIVLFGGGDNSTSPFNTVDIYNVTSGTWTNAKLSVARSFLAATSVTNRYAIFAGGAGYINSSTVITLNTVDIYDLLSGTWNTTTLSQARGGLTAASTGDLAFFAGGLISQGNVSNVVDIFNSTSQTWSTATLSQGRVLLASASIGEIVMFGGGGNDSNLTSYSVVDVFNVTANIWLTMSLSVAVLCLAATSSKNKIFFGGGINGTASNVVDIFDIPPPQNVPSIPTPQSLLTPMQSHNSTTMSPIWLSPLQQIPSLKFPQSLLSIPSTHSPSLESNNLSTAAIVGIVVGGGTVLIGIGLLLFLILFMKRRKQRKKHNQKQIENNPTGPQVSEAVELESFNQGQIESIRSEAKRGEDNEKSQSEERHEEDSNKLQSEERHEEDSNKLQSEERREEDSNKSHLEEKREEDSNKSQSETKQEDSSSPSRNEQQNLNAPKSNYVPLKEVTRNPKDELEQTTKNARRNSQIAFNEIVVEKKIGEGSYGKVCLGKWNKAPVALKYCRRKGNIDEFMKEIRLMLKLPPHPNIVHLYGVSIDGPQPIIILEYCAGGSLDKLLFGTNEKLSDEHKMRLIQGIAAGMYHLHKFNIVHRDLAARNILLTSGGEPKISDFGLSRVLEQNTEGKTKSDLGPVCWMAPESIAHRKYSKKSDVWMFGIVVYEIVAQREPHKGKSLLDVAMRIRDLGLTPTIPNDCPEKLRQLMQMCWNMDAQQRPGFETICEMLE